jgi:hypothetical protein
MFEYKRGRTHPPAIIICLLLGVEGVFDRSRDCC